ncbi:ankyrin repeat domain-containing protein 34A-like [Haliotis asinina]|uniref:ankyrin repeat domain-containing protein 34A-like n=1 Tax=Haliotis asinina TaxID=109174 RepID=UPI0035325F17
MANEEQGRYEIVSNSNDEDKNLFKVISYGKVQRLSSLLSKTEDLDVRDSCMRTPLIHAIFLSKDDVRAHVVRLLLRYGSDVNAQDAEGRTALMYACMEDGKVDSVRLLIRCKKCDPNIQDREGYTALMHAAVSGNTAGIRILTNHANTKNVLKINAVSKQGLSALELAVKLRLSDVCKVLVQEGCADTCVKDKSALFDILRDDSRTNTPFNQRFVTRHGFSPRAGGTPINPISMRASPFMRQNSDLHRRVLLSPSAELSSPIPGKVQNTSGIYQRLLNSPNAQFPVSPREMVTPGLANLDIIRKQPSSRRPLTPITPRNSALNENSPSPVNTLPQPTRLPSIPSGKRVHLENRADKSPREEC